jgi:catechol 2,3-dioxygenase-like lactoylglutathione lyase family enzyme
MDRNVAETGGHPNQTKELAMDYKLELIAVPVSDVDRAKDFYTRIGFHADHDHTVSDEVRFVQLTPPGSACSIAFGKGLTDAEPGTAVGMQLVVSNADQARAELLQRGVTVDEVQALPWGRFVFFADPDGNRWSVQEIPQRG